MNSANCANCAKTGFCHSGTGTLPKCQKPLGSGIGTVPGQRQVNHEPLCQNSNIPKELDSVLRLRPVPSNWRTHPVRGLPAERPSECPPANYNFSIKARPQIMEQSSKPAPLDIPYKTFKALADSLYQSAVRVQDLRKQIEKLTSPFSEARASKKNRAPIRGVWSRGKVHR